LEDTDCSLIENECGGGGGGGDGGGDSGPIFTVTVTTTGLPDPSPSPDPCYDAASSIGCAAQVDGGGAANGADNAGGGGAIPAAQQLINAAYGAADRLFSPTCAGLFLPVGAIAAGVQALAQTLENLADTGIIRQIAANNLPANTPGNIPAFTSGPGGIIYAVTGGSFFTGTIDGKALGGVFSGMPLAAAQQLMILHEFMHYYEGIVGPDTQNQRYTLPHGDVVTGSRGITDEVFKKCF